MTAARVVPALLGLFAGVAIGVAIGFALRPAAPGSPAPPRGESRDEAQVDRPPVTASERREESDQAVPDRRETPSPSPAPTGSDADVDEVVAGLGVRLAEAMRRRRGPEDVRAVLLEALAREPIEGGPAWVLADGARSAEVLEAVLASAGIELDAAAREALRGLADRMAADVAAARDREGPGSERRALRRSAEAALEAGLLDEVLHSEQARRLAEALGGEPVTDLLPGGRDGDVFSSTGADRARMETLVLGTYRDRIGLAGDPPPAVREATARYVTAVAALDADLEARYGRGLVEAVCSGPSAHTEAAREARKDPDYGRRELEARAAYWRLQGEFERAIEPYLAEEQWTKLREASPAGLRFTVE